MRRALATLAGMATLVSLAACQPITSPPDRAPWIPTTPTLATITITIPPCGSIPPGNACYSAPSTLADNAGTETAMPETGSPGRHGTFMLTLPVCATEDQPGPCVWLGGSNNTGRHYIAMPPNLIFPI